MNAPPRSLFLHLKPVKKANRRTIFEFSIQIGEDHVWPVLGEDVTLDIQIDDLLAYLTEFWKPLLLRQVYPMPFNPIRPSRLRSDALERWEGVPQETADREGAAVAAFEEAHDLAHAFAGLFGLPAFWLLRAGDDMICETAGELWRLPFRLVRSALNATGDKIADHLEQIDKDRWHDAAEAWRKRDVVDPVSLLAWAAGLRRDVADTFIVDGTLSPPSDFEDAAKDEDELRIAARMAGALPPDQIRDILSIVRQFTRREAPDLQRLAAACRGHIAERFSRMAPFVQGEAAARFVREWLTIESDARFDIFSVMQALDIDLRDGDVEPPTLDGLAIWGAHYGPSTFLNTKSRRLSAQTQAPLHQLAGARVTLAHEFCHLLLDGAHALSAVDVLSNRMPRAIEQRAGSFAGEILLPSRMAAATWVAAGRPTDRLSVGEVVTDLADRYGVTRSVAAWKLDHGAQAPGVSLTAVLDAVAPWR